MGLFNHVNANRLYGMFGGCGPSIIRKRIKTAIDGSPRAIGRLSRQSESLIDHYRAQAGLHIAQAQLKLATSEER